MVSLGKLHFVAPCSSKQGNTSQILKIVYMELPVGKARPPLASETLNESERQQLLTGKDHSRLIVIGAGDLRFHIFVLANEHTSFTATFRLPV
jgi:hypothetical protein